MTYGGAIKPPALAWRQQHSPPPVKSVSPAHAHAWMRHSILSNGRRSAGLQQLKHFDWLPDVRPRRDKSRSNVHYGHILMYSMKLFCCGAGGGGQLLELPMHTLKWLLLIHQATGCLGPTCQLCVEKSTHWKPKVALRNACEGGGGSEPGDGLPALSSKSSRSCALLTFF